MKVLGCVFHQDISWDEGLWGISLANKSLEKTVLRYPKRLVRKSCCCVCCCCSSSSSSSSYFFQLGLVTFLEFLGFSTSHKRIVFFVWKRDSMRELTSIDERIIHRSTGLYIGWREFGYLEVFKTFSRSCSQCSGKWIYGKPTPCWKCRALTTFRCFRKCLFSLRFDSLLQKQSTTWGSSMHCRCFLVRDVISCVCSPIFTISEVFVPPTHPPPKKRTPTGGHSQFCWWPGLFSVTCFYCKRQNCKN